MSARDQFDGSLTAWMTEKVSSPLPAGRFEQAMAATARRRPRPRWLAAFGSDWVGTSGAYSARWAWPGLRRELVLAAIVALLVVAAALVGAQLLRPDPLTWRLGGLAYAVDGDVYVARAEGVPPVLIADGTSRGYGHYSDPQWSPDGEHLMYSTYSTMAPSSESPMPRAARSCRSTGWQPTWAPDSSHIATWGKSSPPGKIFVHALDGNLTSVAIPDAAWIYRSSSCVVAGREGDRAVGVLPHR